MQTEKQAKQEILNSDWSVKGVKFMKGHDADAMSCTLYYKGKRVASVFDDSWGGQFQYEAFSQKQLKDHREKMDLFGKFARQFKVPSEYQPKGMKYNVDIVVDILVNDFEETKQLKRRCKTKTLVSTPDCGEGQFYVYDIKWNIYNADQFVQHLDKRFPDGYTIINERFEG